MININWIRISQNQALYFLSKHTKLLLMSISKIFELIYWAELIFRYSEFPCIISNYNQRYNYKEMFLAQFNANNQNFLPQPILKLIYHTLDQQFTWCVLDRFNMYEICEDKWPQFMIIPSRISLNFLSYQPQELTFLLEILHKSLTTRLSMSQLNFVELIQNKSSNSSTMQVTPIFERQHEGELRLMRKRFGTQTFEKCYLSEKKELLENYIDNDPQYMQLKKTEQSQSANSKQTMLTSRSTEKSVAGIPRQFTIRRFIKQQAQEEVQFAFPDWMVERKDFKDLKKSKYFDLNFKIVSICEIDSFKRDEGQKTIVALYLQKLSLFKLMPFDMLFDLGGRLTTKVCQPGDVLCRQGEPGDCMFIIYRGEVQVVGPKGEVFKVFGENEHLGRNALETDAPRSATLVCGKESYILVLARWDFQQCLSNLFKIERPKWKEFVESIHFFRNFKEQKITRLCEELKGKFMSTKDCLYKVGDEVDNFYIVKNGTLVKNVVVDLEQSNRWPNKPVEWQKRTVVTRLKIPLKYQAKSLLGYYEMVTSESLGLKNRTETIDAAEDCFVLYIPKAKFNDIFDADDQKRFAELHAKLHPTSFEKLIEKVKIDDEQKKLEYNSIKDAITDGLSRVPSSQLASKQRKFQRVLFSAKKKLDEYRAGKEILKVEARIKIIKSYYE